jgi:predicted RNA-binding protein (virulence factor B family)
MEIGKINSLKVTRDTPHGMFLEDEEGEDVLLPGKYLKGDEKEGDMIDVFIYNDSEDRLVATTQTPKIQLDEFAVLQVVDVNKFGVFLDWGLDKDLLVPFKEQNKKMIVGKKYLVRMYLDDDTDRLVATGKIRRFLSNDPVTVSEKEMVELIVFSQSELGFDVAINKKHTGIIYRNEVFRPIDIGDKMNGYVKKIREDGKIDVSLQPEASEHVDHSSEVILHALNANEGRLDLTDKSSPEEIYRILHMSKKTFKKAIGGLYKRRMIKIQNDHILLVEA